LSSVLVTPRPAGVRRATPGRLDVTNSTASPGRHTYVTVKRRRRNATSMRMWSAGGRKYPEERNYSCKQTAIRGVGGKERPSQAANSDTGRDWETRVVASRQQTDLTLKPKKGSKAVQARDRGGSCVLVCPSHEGKGEEGFFWND